MNLELTDIGSTYLNTTVLGFSLEIVSVEYGTGQSSGNAQISTENIPSGISVSKDIDMNDAKNAIVITTSFSNDNLTSSIKITEVQVKAKVKSPSPNSNVVQIGTTGKYKLNSDTDDTSLKFTLDSANSCYVSDTEVIAYGYANNEESIIVPKNVAGSGNKISIQNKLYISLGKIIEGIDSNDDETFTPFSHLRDNNPHKITSKVVFDTDNLPGVADPKVSFEVTNTSLGESDKITINSGQSATDFFGNYISKFVAGFNDFITHKYTKSGNPHSVTKAQVGLDNVENYAVNDMPVTYTEATTLANITSGERLAVAFGKISRAVSEFISHNGSGGDSHAGATSSSNGFMTSTLVNLLNGISDRFDSGILKTNNGGTGVSSLNNAKITFGTGSTTSSNIDNTKTIGENLKIIYNKISNFNSHLTSSTAHDIASVTKNGFMSSSQALTVGWLKGIFKDGKGQLPVAYGGTGKEKISKNALVSGNDVGAIKEIATQSGALYATSQNESARFGVLPEAQGGTGKTSLAKVTVGNVSGTVSVAHGGTGKSSIPVNSVMVGSGNGTSIDLIESTQGSFYSTGTNAKPSFGTLPINCGGTGGGTASSARTNLGAASNTDLNSVKGRVEALEFHFKNKQIAKSSALTISQKSAEQGANFIVTVSGTADKDIMGMWMVCFTNGGDCGLKTVVSSKVITASSSKKDGKSFVKFTNTDSNNAHGINVTLTGAYASDPITLS